MPYKLEDITSAWLTSVMQENRVLPPDTAVVSFKLEPIGAGVGMMSSMSRIYLDYSSSVDAPASLVIKFPAENETNRSVAQQYRLYEKETRYYQELASRTNACSPKIYSTFLDEESEFHLLMEDVSDYRMGSQVDGATADECELCISELVKLHASFWNNIEEVAWLPHIANSENASNMAAGARVGWDQMMQIFGDKVPTALNEQREAYLDRIDSLQQQLDVAPITFVHGDFRLDNMLFGQLPDHHPLVVVDFQGPLKGKGIQDVAYLLSHSAQTAVRREHEKRLVRYYVDGLVAAGVEGYDFDEAWQDYRIAVLYCWTVAVVIAGTMDPDNERGYAWMSKMVERNGAAIEDLGCLELL